MNRLFVLDMDEVLADFVQAACDLHGRAVDTVQSWLFYEQQWGITSDDFWGPIHAEGDGFYGERVQPKPWAYDLFERVTTLGDVVVMSSPGIGKPVDYAAKRIWIDKYFPGVKLIVGSEKHLLAGPRRMLIDDNETTCDKFFENGGNVCLVPYPWNRHRDKISDRLPFVGQQIDAFVRNTN